MSFLFRNKTAMPAPGDALPGRDQPLAVPATHYVLGTPLAPPFPADTERAIFGMGCFWGAERDFWQAAGVFTTAVGYSGGFTPNPTYEEVCSGRTGQNEVVLVVHRPAEISYDELLRLFWEGHDPTQGCGRETTWVRSTGRRSTRPLTPSTTPRSPRGTAFRSA